MASTRLYATKGGMSMNYICAARSREREIERANERRREKERVCRVAGILVKRRNQQTTAI